MKRTLLLICITGWMLNSTAQDQSQKLSALLAAYSEGGRFNGSVLVASKGKVLLEQGYGFKNVSSRTSNDANTIYQIASITKTFTATLTLKLIEWGKLKLTDKLSKFYPQIPKADSVSIEQLLTHTSGISDNSSDTTVKIYQGQGENSFIKDVSARKYNFSPGDGWMYSNSGYILLGYIIEKVAGLSYYDVARELIFRPLQMNNSGFDFVHLQSPHKASGYWTFPEDSKTIPATVIDSSASRAAGAIILPSGICTSGTGVCKIKKF